MSNIAVIYKSNYGTTKQYATWIAEELGAKLLEHKQVTPDEISGYDCVVYGGGLYASGIIGVDLVVKNPTKNLVIFTVGLADPKTTDYSEILQKNIPKQMQDKTKVFHLRGGMDYKELGLVHRGMMAMMKKVTERKKANDDLNEEDKEFLRTYGDNVCFMEKNTILPLVDYVKSIDMN